MKTILKNVVMKCENLDSRVSQMILEKDNQHIIKKHPIEFKLIETLDGDWITDKCYLEPEYFYNDWDGYYAYDIELEYKIERNESENNYNLEFEGATYTFKRKIRKGI